MRVFCVEYFQARDDKRRSEIDECFAHNIGTGYFDRFIVFSDDPLPNCAASRPVEVVPLGRRFVYRDFLERATDPACVYVLANADIKMLDGMAYLDFLTERDFWALTRWEDNSSGPRHPARESQDTWIIRGRSWDRELLGSCEIRLGLPGCENALAGHLHNAGFRVKNYCHDICTVHIHADPSRTYDQSDRIGRPYFLPNPERIPWLIKLRRCLKTLVR